MAQIPTIQNNAIPSYAQVQMTVRESRFLTMMPTDLREK